MSATNFRLKHVMNLLLTAAGFFVVLSAWRYGGVSDAAHFVKAARAEVLGARVNEIAWMGTANSANDEWLELYNSSDAEIDLSGWTLNAADGQPNITLAGKIAVGGYWLLERTSDDNLPSVAADQIYTGALGNAGESLELKDGGGAVIDRIDASGGWPAGDNASKATMERAPDGGWQTSLAAGGTPKASNSVNQAVQVVPPPTSETGSTPATTGSQVDTASQTSVNQSQAPVPAATEAPASTTNTASTSQNQGVEPLSTQTTERGSTPAYELGQVVINELVSDPTDGQVEWLELFNTTSREVDLTNWTIEEGSGEKTSLNGRLLISGDGRFMVVEKIKGNLNNAGDLVVLRDAGGKLIDQVAYGQWDDGSKDNNAPVAPDPASLARITDGQNSFNNAADFAATLKLTKGKSNIIETASEEENESGINYDYSQTIALSEIFPNPVGADNDQEFIELYNSGSSTVNLLGWSLSVGDRRVDIEDVATSTLINAHGYLTIWRGQSKLVLKNDSATVKLYQPLKDKIFQRVSYKNVKEGWSYNNKYNANTRMNANDANVNENSVNMSMNVNDVNGKWVWSEMATPGAVNVIKTANHLPAVDFDAPESIMAGQAAVFDSSDTADEDGDELTFSWYFGDGVKINSANPAHTYVKAGIFTIALTVSDGQGQVKKEKIIKVAPSQPPPRQAGGEGDSMRLAAGDGRGVNFITDRKGEVIINEILPNPEGSDAAGEWLELKNLGQEKINLVNWQVVNRDHQYIFTADQWLEPESFFLLKRAQSKLVLNNTSEVIKLLDQTEELWDQVAYVKAPSGQAYARGQNHNWFWTNKLTPGADNIITAASNIGETGDRESGIRNQGNGKNVVLPIETDLSKIKEFEIGDALRIKGVVAVEPGILGAQIFYAASPLPTSPTASRGGGWEGAAGIQIYNYNKDFPVLRLGDLVEITGELSQSREEIRLKTKAKADIKVLKHDQPLVALELSCDKITDEMVGKLVELTGEVTAKKSLTLYLDDGTDEALAYIKKASGIKLADIKAGDIITLTGIVGRTASGIKVQPRYQTDIIKQTKVTAADAGSDPRVLGETAVNDQWQIAAKDKKLELFKYLLIIAGALLVAAVGMFVKYRKQKV